VAVTALKQGRWVPASAAVVAVASSACVAVGAGLVSVPAGLVVAGVEGLVGSWVAYGIWARRPL